MGHNAVSRPTATSPRSNRPRRVKLNRPKSSHLRLEAAGRFRIGRDKPAGSADEEGRRTAEDGEKEGRVAEAFQQTVQRASVCRLADDSIENVVHDAEEYEAEYRCVKEVPELPGGSPRVDEGEEKRGSCDIGQENSGRIVADSNRTGTYRGGARCC